MKKIIIVIVAICAIAFVIDEFDSDSTEINISNTETKANYGTASSNNKKYNNNNNAYYGDYGTICSLCNGAGSIQCSVCQGTGKNPIYDRLDGILKQKEKPYCVSCNGSGRITCGRCHGTGVD